MNRFGTLMVACCLALIAGCLGSTAQQSMQHSAPSSPTTSAPAADESHATAQAAQQSGQGNLTNQVDAHGWTGIEYSRTDAVPIGQVVLMAMMLVLSHRREMARIKQNGHCHICGTVRASPYDMKPPPRTPKPDVPPVGQGTDHVHPAYQRTAARSAKGSPRCRSR
ncbi:MAG: hypothetical protein HRU71_12940 [Planctomycetia bacterium]|nr:MAG: hypothetical protein HRU71_12940 [Planctomycetia bacterium]